MLFLPVVESLVDSFVYVSERAVSGKFHELILLCHRQACAVCCVVSECKLYPCLVSAPGVGLRKVVAKLTMERKNLPAHPLMETWKIFPPDSFTKPSELFHEAFHPVIQLKGISIATLHRTVKFVQLSENVSKICKFGDPDIVTEKCSQLGVLLEK